jgi:hypothetical protein
MLVRKDSVSKIYNHTSSDSIDVENTLIMKIKP